MNERTKESITGCEDETTWYVNLNDVCWTSFERFEPNIQECISHCG